MEKSFKESFSALKSYCESQDFAGWDPYDGLNSLIFKATPLKRWPVARLAWIQLFKRSPVNLRRLLLVPKAHNPKGLGLFLSGYCNLYHLMKKDGRAEYGTEEEILGRIDALIKSIMQLRSEGYSGDCWGYNFDWQAKAFFQPAGTPTVVATAFIGSALLDAFEITGDNNLLLSARSSCDFILKDLNRTSDGKGNFAFSYSPLDKTAVFNASLLGSRLLSRVYHFTGEKILIDEARKSVEFCCSNQRADGSWGYGTLDFHQWVDNFHTGYNLECISAYSEYSGDTGFTENLEKGFSYYINTFFTPEGMAKYYNNEVYPVDIHAPAQLVITLAGMGKFNDYKETAARVLGWTIRHMQSDSGYFYYQKRKHSASRIPFMRWAQAWMFYALSEYLLQSVE